MFIEKTAQEIEAEVVSGKRQASFKVFRPSGSVMAFVSIFWAEDSRSGHKLVMSAEVYRKGHSPKIGEARFFRSDRDPMTEFQLAMQFGRCYERATGEKLEVALLADLPIEEGDFIKDGLTCGLVMGKGTVDFGRMLGVSGYLVQLADGSSTFVREADAVLIAKAA